MLKYVLGIVATLIAATPAYAGELPTCVARYVSGAELVGNGSYTFLIKNVYDADLYAPKQHYNPAKPFALSLTYHMNFKGKKISQKSIEEMKGLGADDKDQLAQWQAKMDEIFPDVTDGDTLTGIHTADGKTIFCDDDKKIGVINDPEFGQYFFGIWLNKNTEDKSLRAKLLNLAP